MSAAPDRMRTPLPRYPDDVLDSILQALDLADVVGRYVPLKRSGKSWKGCCPFHQEKTASFYVVPEKRLWKCFGCQKGGNAFTFLVERETITFPEAVRQLAKEAGVVLPEDDDPAAAELASRLARLRDVCEWACRFFQKELRAQQGEPARAYFKRRGITGETARLFRLGFAPPGWQNLIDAARADGVTEADLVDLGLARRKEADDGRPSRFFDMFRDRVTFPICDTQGRVIAFGARTLGDDEPKYLNSPESPLFSKGRTVYALHLAKQAMQRTGEGAVMEGYTDVLMAHQCGWPVAVAGLGTALTAEQASLIARYVKRLHLVYDGDSAGQKAARRNAPVFLAEEIETRVAVLPAGEDPCDTLLRAGLPALRACVDAGREAFDHLLFVLRSTHDLSSVPGKAQALDEALAALLPVTNDVRRALYLTRVCDEYAVDEGVVRERFRELRTKASSTPRRAPAPPRSESHDAAPPRLADQVAESVAPAAAPDRAAPDRAAPRSGPPTATEAWLVEALLGRPELCAEASERLAADSVTHPLCRRLFDLLVGRWEETGQPPRVDLLLGAIEDPELASFAAGLVSRSEGKDLATQGRDCIARLAGQHEARALREGQVWMADPSESRRGLLPEEDDSLRRDIEFHRRRAAGT
jgi:DNA primase